MMTRIKIKLDDLRQPPPQRPAPELHHAREALLELIGGRHHPECGLRLGYHLPAVVDDLEVHRLVGLTVDPELINNDVDLLPGNPVGAAQLATWHRGEADIEDTVENEELHRVQVIKDCHSSGGLHQPAHCTGMHKSEGVQVGRVILEYDRYVSFLSHPRYPHMAPLRERTRFLNHLHHQLSIH